MTGTRPVRIAGVAWVRDFVVRLTFTDGTEREADLEMYLRGPVFERIRNDLDLFRSVRVDGELGTLVWPNEADIDPDVLYRGWAPAWQTDSPT